MIAAGAAVGRDRAVSGARVPVTIEEMMERVHMRCGVAIWPCAKHMSLPGVWFDTRTVSEAKRVTLRRSRGRFSLEDITLW